MIMIIIMTIINFIIIIVVNISIFMAIITKITISSIVIGLRNSYFLLIL